MTDDWLAIVDRIHRDTFDPGTPPSAMPRPGSLLARP
jgi:hypothetical protein